MMGQEETIAWIMANWVVTKPISKEQIVSHDQQAIIAWYSYYTEARMDVAVAMIQEKGLYDEWISRFKEQWSKKRMDPVVNPKEA
jgi:hypothetical protein